MIKQLFRTSIITLFIFNVIISIGNATVVNKKSIAEYNVSFTTQALGNYSLIINTTEIPFQQMLPSYSGRDKSVYYSKSSDKVEFEVDNTAPDAWYDVKNKVKVDVIFATGQLTEMDSFTGYMDQFEAKLSKASNNFDVMVKKVETVKGGFSMEDADPSTIYNFWDQYPNPNNYVLQNNTLINVPYSWNGYTADTGRGGGSSRFNQVFIESESYGVEDFEISCSLAWHGCCTGSGLIVRWDLDRDEAYVLMCENDLSLRKVSNLTHYIGHNYESGSCGLWIRRSNIGRVIGSCNEAWPTSGYGRDIKIEGKGNKFIVTSDGELMFECEDNDNPIEAGALGLLAGCVVTFKDIKVAYDKTEKRTLGEAVQDVEWRDNSVRFVIYATDSMPLEYDITNDNRKADLIYTIAKLYNANCYLVNLGNEYIKNAGTKNEFKPNKEELEDLLGKILQADGTKKGEYFKNEPITTAMDESIKYIQETAQQFITSENWILVNTEVLWDTGYEDSEKERDLPLNYGEHDGKHAQPQDTYDIELSSILGVPITYNYSDAKLLAEKWRYRHFNHFFDNSDKQETYHEIWIENPVEIFTYPGKYRINYKRKDNPFHTNASLSYAFDNYRYWSTRYDYKVTNN